MRRKARPKRAPARGAKATANSNAKARENTHLMGVKQTWKPSKTPTGKGLGKAGAKRLGRLLKRAIKVPEFTGKGKASLPTTPVRLFKHQLQSEAENASTAKLTSLHVSQLILTVVSQCKHQGGMSMAELKKTLAVGGYNVTKNSKQVNVVTQQLVSNETLIRTRRNVFFRLDKNTQQTTNSVTTKTKDLKKKKTARKTTKREEKSQRQVRRTPKPKGKSQKAKAQTRTTARWKTPAGKKRRSPKNQRGRLLKAPRRTQRTQRRRPKQNRRQTYKPKTKRRLPRMSSRSKPGRRAARRRVNYYYY